jgi:membrane protein YdbS with pleckstrin-like domain
VKRLRWESARGDGSVPKHPYRDTALVYLGFALVVVVLALATGGGIVRAVVIAAFVYIAATLWSWRIWRNRLREHEAAERERTNR